MASSGKKKTTMAKIMRESRLRERRLDKQARKDARKNAPAQDTEPVGFALDPMTGEPLAAPEHRAPLDAAVPPLAEA